MLHNDYTNITNKKLSFQRITEVDTLTGTKKNQAKRTKMDERNRWKDVRPFADFNAVLRSTFGRKAIL